MRGMRSDIAARNVAVGHPILDIFKVCASRVRSQEICGLKKGVFLMEKKRGCTVCNGTGRVEAGFHNCHMIEEECPYCGGTGYSISENDTGQKKPDGKNIGLLLFLAFIGLLVLSFLLLTNCG